MEMIQAFIESITSYISSIPQIVPILLSLIIGIALVGWGYSLFRFWLTILGVVVGYYLGTELATFLALDSWPYVLVVLLITIAMSLFFWLAVKFSIFVAAFFYGMFLVRYLSITLLAWDERITTLVGGVILAILAVAFLKIFIVAATAISGAYLVSDAIFSLLQSYLPHVTRFRLLWSLFWSGFRSWALCISISVQVMAEGSASTAVLSARTRVANDRDSKLTVGRFIGLDRHKLFQTNRRHARHRLMSGVLSYFCIYLG